MQQIIQSIVSLFFYVFILTSMLGAGLGLTMGELFEPIKKVKLVIWAFIINFVLIPAMAYGLCVLLKVEPSMQAGLMILACCAGAPFLPRLTLKIKGNMAYAVGLMVFLIIVTVGFCSLVLPFIIPGLSVSPWGIAKPLIILMLLPLVVGLLVRTLKTKLALLLKPLADKASALSLIVLVVFGLALDYKIIISAWGTGAYNLVTLFTILAMLIGYFFGGADKKDKLVMMLGSGGRNIPAALLIAATNFSDPKVTTVVLIGSLMQFIILFLFVKWYGGHKLASYKTTLPTA